MFVLDLIVMFQCGYCINDLLQHGYQELGVLVIDDQLVKSLCKFFDLDDSVLDTLNYLL
jgi:hypothetical protein